MMSQTASPHLPRKSWGCLISTLLLVLAVLGLVVYGAITLGIALPTGYATSERRGGESPEKLAKTTEMCLPERKRVRKTLYVKP